MSSLKRFNFSGRTLLLGISQLVPSTFAWSTSAHLFVQPHKHDLMMWFFANSNSRIRSGSSRGAGSSLTRRWEKGNSGACCALAPWISGEYPVSSKCSKTHATSRRVNRDSHPHKANVKASPLKETGLTDAFFKTI